MSENNFNSNWQCICGQINNGNFCASCGRPKMQVSTPPVQPQPQYQPPKQQDQQPQKSVSKIKTVNFIVSLIGIIVAFLANLPGLGMSLMMAGFSPLFMMLGAQSEEAMLEAWLVFAIECIVLAAFVLSIIFNIRSHKIIKRGPYKKYKPFRIFIAIAAMFSAVASIISTIWLNTMDDYIMMYIIPVMAIIFGIATLVVNIIVISSKTAEE